MINGEATLAARVEKLEHDLATVVWLYAEIIHTARMTVVRQLLADPAIQEQVGQRLLTQISSP